MTDPFLQQARAVGAAATKEPWVVKTDIDWSDFEYDADWYCWQTPPPSNEDAVVNGYGTCKVPDECEGHKILRPTIACIEGPKFLKPDEESHYWRKEDAAFIAFARNHWSTLLARLEAAERVVAHVEYLKTFLDAEPKRYSDLITAVYEGLHSTLTAFRTVTEGKK